VRAPKESPYDASGTYLYASFYPNGQLNTSVQLIEFRQDGLLRAYYPNGNIKFTQFWKNGIRTGDTRFYDSTSRLVLHQELKFNLVQGVQQLGKYEYFRDTAYFPLEERFNRLSKENRTVVVPDVIGKLDSMVTITPPIDTILTGTSCHAIQIPNVPFSTIRIGVNDALVKWTSYTTEGCGYGDIEKVYAMCFNITPNDSVKTLTCVIQAVINDSVIHFNPRTIIVQ
jgi:hypothetical protein